MAAATTVPTGRFCTSARAVSLSAVNLGTRVITRGKSDRRTAGNAPTVAPVRRFGRGFESQGRSRGSVRRSTWGPSGAVGGFGVMGPPCQHVHVRENSLPYQLAAAKAKYLSAAG